MANKKGKNECSNNSNADIKIQGGAAAAVVVVTDSVEQNILKPSVRGEGMASEAAKWPALPLCVCLTRM